MAERDKRVTELNAITVLTADDTFYVVNDPEGAPQPRRITFGSLSSELIGVLTSQEVVSFTGKVGIGMTPGAKLDVNGLLRITSVDCVPTTGAGVEIFYYNGAGHIQAYDRDDLESSSKNLVFGSDMKALGSIDMSGGLTTVASAGIGCVPSSKLDVDGVIRSKSANGTPVSGSGVEFLLYDGKGYLQAMNRDAGAYLPMNVTGTDTSIYAMSELKLQAGSDEVLLGGGFLSVKKSYVNFEAPSRSDYMLFGLFQNDNGPRTYGGYFLLDIGTSNIRWVKRTANADTTVFTITNDYGYLGIGSVTAPSVNLHVNNPSAYLTGLFGGGGNVGNTEMLGLGVTGNGTPQVQGFTAAFGAAGLVLNPNGGTVYICDAVHITSVSPILTLLSANPAGWGGLALGRTAIEGYWGIAAAPNQFFDGAAPGDLIFRVEDPTKAIRMGVYQGGVTYLTIAAGGTIVGGNFQATGGFACNNATPQGSYSSGGALSAYGSGANGFDSGAHASELHAMVVKMRAALVANGIMS